ncbi:MAG: ATP-binding cassette domain-containing protein, partial [Candidatus Latescibacterota bacterium]|nr:ATP-binding cassette domain-containing protein [Candidatus Latescibacterota bacterium]
GKVAIPKRLRLGVLRQDQFLYEDHSILAVTLMGHQELWKVMVEKEKLLAKAETHFDADRFSELEELVERYDGYSAEARASMILEGLGLPSSIHHDPLSTLSGGFKLRVLLAQVLASEPDALLLDEPTNHLDILSIRWLETFLRDFAGPLVVISHDHRFLDNVVTHILDVDYETVTLYHGNYTRFVDSKKTERSRREKDIAARERDIAEHQKTVDRFRAKASKARQAQSKEKMLEKMADSIEDLAPSSRRYPNFKFTQVRDSGRDVLTVKGVKKAFDDNEVLHGVDLQLQRGDRMAIMGPNGIGKSTLLKIIMDDLVADEGTVEWGYETHPEYFAQDHREQFDSPNNTAEGWIWGFCADQSIGYVRGNLGMVLFSGDDVEKRLGDLSGGEAARLIFAKLAIAQPNVLVLDEPTNHLDLESIEALVEGLQAFPGTLILVSHDRWFVSQLATRIVEIRPDDIHDYHGTYEEYVHFCGDDHLDADRVVLKAKNEKRRKKEEKTSDDASKKGSAQNRSKRNSKASRKRDQKQQEALLTRIEDAETRMKEIDETLCTPGFYADTPADDVRDLERERAHLERDVAEWTTEWERAEETASR